VVTAGCGGGFGHLLRILWSGFVSLAVCSHDHVVVGSFDRLGIEHSLLSCLPGQTRCECCDDIPVDYLGHALALCCGGLLCMNIVAWLAFGETWRTR
jgi:hypothetical protein